MVTFMLLTQVRHPRRTPAIRLQPAWQSAWQAIQQAAMVDLPPQVHVLAPRLLAEAHRRAHTQLQTFTRAFARACQRHGIHTEPTIQLHYTAQGELQCQPARASLQVLLHHDSSLNQRLHQLMASYQALAIASAAAAFLHVPRHSDTQALQDFTTRLADAPELPSLSYLFDGTVAHVCERPSSLN
jgi:hypothetical protein